MTLYIPWNPATSLGRPGEYTVGRGVSRPSSDEKPVLYAFQGWTLACVSRPTQAFCESYDEPWRAVVRVYLTTRRKVVTVVELERDPPSPGVRPLVLAAQAHAGWRGARSWLGFGTEVLPCLSYVPDLRDVLDATLRDAIARAEQRIRDAGWARDDT